MRPHGTRAKYVAEKCRCNLCRKANRDYANERARRAKDLAALLNQAVTGTVKVLKSVRKKGGARGENELRLVTAKQACPGFGGKPCVKGTYLKKNSTGTLCSYCREHVLSQHQLVSANRARDVLRYLSKAGEGSRTVAILTNLMRNTVRRIATGETKLIDPETEDEILNLLLPEPDLKASCPDCDLSHEKMHRLARLALMLPCRVDEVQDAYPCVYPRSDAGERKLYRDLNELAHHDKGTWYPKEKGTLQ